MGRAMKVGYQSYVYRGHRIERSANPTVLPCRRWAIRSGVLAGHADFTFRGAKALIDAALALREEGRNPTLDEVAEQAMVSRATAYRYFPSIAALVRETTTRAKVPVGPLPSGPAF